MKQPKAFLLLSIIVAVLVLGIAYAAIGNITLNVNGNVVASPNEENFKVRFATGTGTKVSGTGSGTFDLVNTDANQLSAKLSASGFTTKGQTATYKIEIENASQGDLKAKLSFNELTPTLTLAGISVTDGATTVVAGANNYFSVDATLDTEEIAPGAKATLTVTITMLKTPLDNLVGEFTFKIYASPVNA